MGMTENTLYVRADDIIDYTVLSLNQSQNNTANEDTTGSDVYSVVKKTWKFDTPDYAEVRKSKPEKNKPAIKKKPKDSDGKTMNKDGLIYVQVDLKGTPSKGKPVIHGAENKTLYVDIDFTKHVDDPVPECEVEEIQDIGQNVQDSHHE